MSLKQHNDIVQKLVKQIDVKDKQIEQLRRQLHKSGTSSIPQTKTADFEKQLNKKITQLHKQYKQKISTLTQQVRSKSNQNKDLKQRLNIQKNIEAKQKQQVSQILKKTAAMSANDPKFAAMVSHYESQIQRKDKHIANLQKQMKQNYYKSKSTQTQLHNQKQRKSLNTDDNEQQNQQPIHDNITDNKTKMPNILNQQQYHTKYQQQITALKTQSNKYQRLFEQKSKQFKDLTKRYSQLTKQYYRILNQYGGKQHKIQSMTNMQPSNSNKNLQSKNSKLTKNKNINLLQQMLYRFDQQTNPQLNQLKSQTSLSYSFLSNYNKTKQQQNPKQQNQRQLQILQDIIENIQQILNVQNRLQIVPALTKLKTKLEQISVYENISKYVHSMLYRMGMGKVPMSQVVGELQKFQVRVGKFVQASDLLDQVCIQVGAKKEKVMDKIKDFKATQEQFFSNMKDVSFMQQLPKANKIMEFIQYFQLDKQICQLPQQLKKMYEQLKYVDKFLKQVALILDREPQGLQRSLQSILRYLQRKQAEQSMKATQKTVQKGTQKQKK